METEQKFIEIEERALKLAHQAQTKYEIVTRVRSNCKSMQYDMRYDWLRDLNARGTHLEDLVYQKLDRINCGHHNCYYVQDALCRIGNRTMNEEEYNLILATEDAELIYDYRNKGVQDIKDRINKKRSLNGGVCWAQGPFHGGPRDKRDTFNVAQKLGYNRDAKK